MKFYSKIIIEYENSKKIKLKIHKIEKLYGYENMPGKKGLRAIKPSIQYFSSTILFKSNFISIEKYQLSL